MAAKRKSPAVTRVAKKVASALHRIAEVAREEEEGRRPDPKQARSEVWSPEWIALTERYGGPRKFAEQILGISYQSLWRYAVRGDDVPAIVVNFVRMLSATQGLKSPV